MYHDPTPDLAAKAPAVTSESFRAAMRELASGVALATTAHKGARAGCVVSSFVSLSLTPPSLLVCLNHNSSTWRAIQASGVFALNILAGDHEALARRFSDPAFAGDARFAQGSWGAGGTGSPLLADALAAIDCRVERVVPYATHVIVIGAALGVVRGLETSALVHRRSRFGMFS